MEAGSSEECGGMRQPFDYTAENAEVAEKRENRISAIVLDAAIAVHTALGPGLLESAYQACLAYELNSRGLKVQTQVPLPINYRGVLIDAAYRIDLLVDDLVIVELKAIERLMPIHEAQLLSYLKLSGKSLGLLINFHVLRLKDGYKRIVNGL
ncbi:MAG TPA: GxxExxY protein [Blattabacteriaceae bacterium]|nr:GxxExxY protein [Blattabacteriaceae bacterium]